MARRYSIAQARSRLPTIVDEAEAGHEIELTRRGEPVAVLVSRQTFDRLRGGRRQFKEAYRTFLERYPLDEIAVSDVREAFPRDRSTGRKVHL
jgi:prevent-host-death family protein